MKKYMLLGAGLCLAMAFTGCKSSESAYKKAYEKAKSQEAAQQQPVTQTTPTVTETPVVTPVQTRPATQTQVTDNYDNVQVRQESVKVVNGAGLRSYSVVVGSFTVMPMPRVFSSV
jgi:PBP1b-binding outer membrane lipoprotein LpoB